MQYPATDRQMKYIASLLETKEVPEAFAEHARGPLSKTDASKVITQLLSYKKRPQVNGLHNWKPDIPVVEMPKHGTYTVVLQEDVYRTIRIRRPHPKANFVVAEYLFGPNNSNDFKRFARETEGGFRLVPGYDMGGILIICLRTLVESDPEKLAEMGFKYALASGNCFRCGRKLTVPASIHRGLGPVCAGKE